MRLGQADGAQPWSHGAALVAPAAGTPTLEYSPDGGTTWFVVPTKNGDASALSAPDVAYLPTSCHIRATGGDAFVSKVSAASGTVK